MLTNGNVDSWNKQWAAKSVNVQRLKWVFMNIHSNLEMDFSRWARWTLRAKLWWRLERELLPQVGGNQKYFHAWECSLSFDQSPFPVLNSSLHYKDLKHVDLAGLMQGLERLFRYFDFSGWACCTPSHPWTQKSMVCSIWNQSLQEYCKKEESGRFKPVPAFTGHGIGTYFHGPPGELLRHTDFPFKFC